MLPHEAVAGRRFGFRDDAAGAIVQKLIDHDPVIAEHCAHQFRADFGNALDAAFQADPVNKIMGQVERLLCAATIIRTPGSISMNVLFS